MRNYVKIEIFLRNLLHKWEMAIFLLQGAAVYKAKKLRTQDDAFGRRCFLFFHAVSLHSFKTVNSLLFASYAKKQWNFGVKVKRTRKILMQ